MGFENLPPEPREDKPKDYSDEALFQAIKQEKEHAVHEQTTYLPQINKSRKEKIKSAQQRGDGATVSKLTLEKNSYPTPEQIVESREDDWDTRRRIDKAFDELERIGIDSTYTRATKKVHGNAPYSPRMERKEVITDAHKKSTEMNQVYAEKSRNYGFLKKYIDRITGKDIPVTTSDIIHEKALVENAEIDKLRKGKKWWRPF